MGIFGKPSGYRWMDVYILANIVELGTDRFCDDSLNFKNDPGGRPLFVEIIASCFTAKTAKFAQMSRPPHP